MPARATTMLPDLPLGPDFELANALAGDPQLASEGGQGARVLLEVMGAHDPPFATVERGQGVPERSAQVPDLLGPRHQLLGIGPHVRDRRRPPGDGVASVV